MRPLQLEPATVGEKVDYDHCLGCGKEMEKDEPRFRVVKGGKVGVGHEGCR